MVVTSGPRYPGYKTPTNIVACGNTIARVGVLQHTIISRWRSELRLICFAPSLMLVESFVNCRCSAIFTCCERQGFDCRTF
jgi:hypothetical protein